jgi:tetraacyldisaccharide 4'-kinase
VSNISTIIENYLFRPSKVGIIIALLLLPLSLIYCLIVWIKYQFARPVDQGIPVVSIGNLVVGGSGKTPFTIALTKHFKKSAIVLRGYGRKSQGLYLISDGQTILEDVYTSGDEAQMYAQMSDAIVIVSEKREEGIAKAKALGAKVVFLDDGYSKHAIKKLDILLHSNVQFALPFCLPSGAYREKLWAGKEALELTEEIDFKREVSVKNPTEKMVLVTAIAKPYRLDPFLPENVVAKHYFSDHYYFDKKELETILDQSGATSLLVTEKDDVKLTNFNLPLSVMELRLTINQEPIQTIKEYIVAKED